MLAWRCGSGWGTGVCDVFCCQRRRAVGSAKGPGGTPVTTSRAGRTVGYSVCLSLCDTGLSRQSKRSLWPGCEKAPCDLLDMHLRAKQPSLLSVCSYAGCTPLAPLSLTEWPACELLTLYGAATSAVAGRAGHHRVVARMHLVLPWWHVWLLDGVTCVLAI